MAAAFFVNARKTYVIEAFLMLQVGIIIGLVGITERSRYGSKYIETSRERLILRIFIVTAGSLFNVCFWWWGLEVMLPTPCSKTGMGHVRRLLDPKVPGHGTYILYIFKTDIYGWAGTLMRIKSIIAAIWTAPKIITFDVVVLVYDWRMRETRTAFTNAMLQGQPKENISRALKEESQRTSNLEAPLEQQPPRQPEADILPLLTPSNPNKMMVPEIKQRLKMDGECLMLLDGIDASLKYFEDLLSIYPESKDTLGKKKPVRLCGGLVHFNMPYRENQCTDTSTSYTSCLWRTFKTQFSNKPSRNLQWRLALHMTASGQHPGWRWPRLINRMQQMSQVSKPPDWRHVAIASDILLTQVPFVVSSRTWMMLAVYQFCIIGYLIAQVEATIVFNNVGGLNSLSTLGQLIPFLLGVGGLVKILWGKWRLLHQGIKEERVREKESDYKKAMALFLERRKPSQERPMTRAVTV